MTKKTRMGTGESPPQKHRKRRCTTKKSPSTCGGSTFLTTQTAMTTRRSRPTVRAKCRRDPHHPSQLAQQQTQTSRKRKKCFQRKQKKMKTLKDFIFLMSTTTMMTQMKLLNYTKWNK